MAIVDITLTILLRALPVIGWAIAIVFAVTMLKRGGGKAERFLFAGASLMLVRSIVSTLTDFIIMWLSDTVTSVGAVIAPVLWSQALLSLAGTICLVYAFWVKFKVTSNA